MLLENKCVVLGVSGGIAVYKACEVVSALRKLGANVFVIMTENATKFVTPQTFETLSNNPVVVDMFARDRQWEVEHISLAKAADIFVVAPATANCIAKFAYGIADDMLSTTMLACNAKKLICPAMNSQMYLNEVTQLNMQTLKDRGWEFLEGESGFLACGDVGVGRLAEPSNIVEKITQMLLPNQDFVGNTVLITAGATRENIDGVRFITNYSSGKMGLALAKSARARGAKVILVCGSVSVDTSGFDVEEVVSTADMYKAVMARLPEADIVIKAAAPADYSPISVAENKIKDEKLTLNFKKNTDIAKAVGEVKGNKKLVIFCAETENLKQNALAKLKNKNADMIVANDVTKEGAGFFVDTNIVSIFKSNGEGKDYPLMSKTDVANIILDEIGTM